MNLHRMFLAFAVIAFSIAGLFTIDKSLGKTKPPQGKWQVASVADAEQYKNPAIPVVVVSVTSGLSDPDADKNRQFLIKEVILENRSNKKVSEITIRWAIAPMNNRLTLLSRGKLATHRLPQLNKQLLAGQRQTLKLSHPKLGQLIEAIPNIEGMGTEFAFVIGVDQVVFEDGSTWKEESTDVINKSATRKL